MGAIFDNLVLLVLFLVPGFLFAKVYRVASRDRNERRLQDDLFFFFIYGFVALLPLAVLLPPVSRGVSLLVSLAVGGHWGGTVSIQALAGELLESDNIVVAALGGKFMALYYLFLLYVVALAALMGRKAESIVWHPWTQKFFNLLPLSRADRHRQQVQQENRLKAEQRECVPNGLWLAVVRCGENPSSSQPTGAHCGVMVFGVAPFKALQNRCRASFLVRGGFGSHAPRRTFMRSARPEQQRASLTPPAPP